VFTVCSSNLAFQLQNTKACEPIGPVCVSGIKIRTYVLFLVGLPTLHGVLDRKKDNYLNAFFKFAAAETVVLVVPP